ncbi:nuclear transport factor 2 family protein [Nonomuraea sp. NPDC049784]|uniref:nuclear transport factor 2 family protein n=1 Tax=Nonomuraea sp. NPDC049784 TaxID=3154361 RepID=UPI0033CA9F0A
MTTRCPVHRPLAAALTVWALLASACGTHPAPTAPTTASAPATGSPADVVQAAQAYVDAVNARDLDALVTAFAPDAEIVDVTRGIRGHDAIRAWADNEVIGGTLRVVSIVERRADGQKLLVHWAPEGSDGWRAHYDFTVAGGRIVRADLQYA